MELWIRDREKQAAWRKQVNLARHQHRREQLRLWDNHPQCVDWARLRGAGVIIDDRDAEPKDEDK
jgi:hypothetical protein